jgi:hypothetical protein
MDEHAYSGSYKSVRKFVRDRYLLSSLRDYGYLSNDKGALLGPFERRRRGRTRRLRST